MSQLAKPLPEQPKEALRLAADLVSWSTPYYRFARIGDGYATGSSMLPNKRNPDIAELIRYSTIVLVTLVILTTLIFVLDYTFAKSIFFLFDQ